MKGVITTEDIRRWALNLPEVTHGRFKVPVFRVSGKTFVEQAWRTKAPKRLVAKHS